MLPPGCICQASGLPVVAMWKEDDQQPVTSRRQRATAWQDIAGRRTAKAGQQLQNQIMKYTSREIAPANG